MRSYNLSDQAGNVEVSLSLSIEMIQDLARFSEYHGLDMQVDLRRRIARSLERDHEKELRLASQIVDNDCADQLYFVDFPLGSN